MRFSFATALVVGLAASPAVASTWFSKAAYNKWNENELERWLSDHDVPYPTPADRKDLENLVKDNWNSATESPYLNWDANQLQSYLSTQGAEIKKGTEKNKDELVKQVKANWKDTGDVAHGSYADIKSWIFDSWTESSLKAFCDKHGIPVPQPRSRDQALQAVRENFQTAADKIGETASYPGNWLYESWSDSDLKAWLDERGIPAPQSGKRDQLVAVVRKNAYNARNVIAETASSATDAAKNYAGSATDSAKGAAQSVSDKIFDTWSESQLKEFADKNGIKIPQGSTKNEILAVVRKNAAKLTGDNVSASAASAYGAATSSAGNYATQVTDAAGSYASSVSQQASATATDLVGRAYGLFNSYLYEAQVLVGLKTNYASSASASASSVYAKASSAVKGEL